MMGQNSGCIIIKFKEGLSGEAENQLISRFYSKNKNEIQGMEYTGFDSIKPISRIKSFIKLNFEKKDKVD